MHKNGFTLIEILGVIILISLLSIIVYSAISTQLNKSKGKISEVNQKLIKTAAEFYVTENKIIYSRIEGNVYCITIQKLVDNDILTKPVLDVNGSEINYSIFVKATYLNGIFSYDIENSCSNTISGTP